MICSPSAERTTGRFSFCAAPGRRPTQRAAGLDLYARVLVALGERERARTTHDELQGIVAEVGSDSLRASALAVEGLVAEAEGDLDMARSRIEDAIDLFHQCGDPFETARSRRGISPCSTQRQGFTPSSGQRRKGTRPADRLGSLSRCRRDNRSRSPSECRDAIAVAGGQDSPS
jgi:hypothetical protein